VSEFSARYGQWALVAGASEGLGAAFAESLAKRGCKLILIARRIAPLGELADRLYANYSTEVRTLALDLADGHWFETVRSLASELPIGLGVYNAACSTIGPLLERPLEDAQRVVEVNVQGPLRFAHALAPQMLARKRGGLVFMSSLAGFQGSPRLAAYAASKAFITVLGESLWGELKPQGVDVLVSAAGAIRTPGYLKTAKKDAPGTLDPSEVSERTLAALGKGPIVVPGGVNKLARVVLGRFLSRRGAVKMMARNTSDLE
jgi:short-subunit dehydrogenase